MEDSQKIYENETRTPERQEYLDDLQKMLEAIPVKNPFGVLEEQEIKEGIQQAAKESEKILNNRISIVPKKIVPIRVSIPPLQKNESKPVEITAGQFPISDIEKEVISVTRETPLTPDQIINTILRNKGEGDPRSGRGSNLRLRISRALESLLDRNLLKAGVDGTFRPTFGFAGGSDRSQELSQVDKIKNTLADGAVWVEDILNQGNIEGIDPSGEGFLGQSGFDTSTPQPEKMVDDASRYNTEAKVHNAFMMRPDMVEKPQNPTYKKIVDAFNGLIKKYDIENKNIKTALKTFFRFKVDGEKIEDIIKNLADVKAVLLPSEYESLVQIAQGKDTETTYPDWLTPEPPPVVKQPIPRQQPKAVPLPRPIIHATSSLQTITREELDRRAEEARNAAMEKLAAEKTVEEKTALIEGAQSFDELYEALRECKVIKSSDGTNIAAQDLIVKIGDVRKQPEYKLLIQRITGECGLRSKVRELLNIETALKMSESVLVEPPLVSTVDVETISDLYDEPIGPMRKEDLSKEESGKIEKELSSKLEESLKHFAAQEALRKEKIRASKKVYEKIMTELGVPSKQRPDAEGDIDQVYLDAKKEYMEAGRALRNFIARRHVEVEETISRPHDFSIIEKKTTKHLDIGVMEQFKKERDTLNTLIAEALPEKERGIMARSMDKWAQLPVLARVALSSAFFSLVSGGVGGFAATASMRAARGFAGAMGAKYAGSVLGKQQQEKMLAEKEKALKNFATIDGGQQDEKIGDFEAYESEAEIQAKRDRIKKAALMMAAGGATSVGTGAVINAAHDALTTAHSAVDAPAPAKSSWWNKLIKEDAPTQKTTIIEKPAASVVEQSIPVTMQPVEVGLSSKGFIDTIDQLKKATQGQSLTPAVEKLFAQSPQKIALDLGLFKPGQAAESAFGFKGEKLSFDAQGNLSLVRDGSGATEILMKSDGTIQPYAGKMFDADGLSTSTDPTPVEDHVVKAQPHQVAPTTPPSILESTPELKVSATPGESMAADAATIVTSSSIENIPARSVNFKDIVSVNTEQIRPADIISGKLPLKLEYQFDPKFKNIRTAYNIELEKRLMDLPADMVDLRYPIEYNGGRINVFQKGSELTILLNGQKIGTGSVIDEGVGLQYDRSLGTGMFGVKSDFEQAFDFARQAVEKNKMFFKLKK